MEKVELLLINYVYVEGLQKAQQDPGIIAFEYTDKSKPLNPDNYIRAKGTISYPIEQAADCDFYYRGV